MKAVSNQVNSTQGTLSKLGANAKQIGTGIGQVAGGLVRVGEIAAVALLGAATASEKVTMGFAADMELIHTQAGAKQQEVIDQSKAILDLAHQVATSPDELAKGLYHIESVGLRGAAALDVLRAGALGAKTGLADMEETTNALTAVAFSGIGGVKDMTTAMGVLDAAVGQGNMRLQDLVDSFGTGILGTSKTFGVSLQSMTAALAVLTDAGVKAQPAATRMQMMFTHMAAPVPAALKIFTRLGLDQFALAKDLRAPDGVFVALDDLRTHLEKTGEMVNGVLTPQGTADVAKIFGGSRFGAAAMQLLQMLDRIPTKYDAINKQAAAFSERVAATFDTTKVAWDQFSGDLQTAAINFGKGIDPAVGRTIHHLDDLLMAHMGDFTKMGIDAGKAIDGIDWAKVEHGAETFIGFLKTGWDILSKIPAELDVIVAGFLGLNKIGGGLFGLGLGNIVGGLGKGISNVLLGVFSKLPIIGGAVGALGAATAMRVFVVNMPAGGFGGLPGAAGAAEAATGIGLATLLGAAALTAIAVAAVAAAHEIISNTIVKRALDYEKGNATTALGATTSISDLEQQKAVLAKGIADISGLAFGLGGVVNFGAIDELKAQMAAVQARIDALGPTNTPTHYAGIGPGTNGQPLGDYRNTPGHYAGIGPGINGPLDPSAAPLIKGLNRLADVMDRADWLKKLQASWMAAGQTMHDKIRAAMAGIGGPNTDSAAAFLGAKLGNAGFGAGGYDQAVAVLAELKALNSHDPVILEAIKLISARLVRLHIARDDLTAAEKEAQSGDPKNVKLDKLNAIMDDLRRTGDRTAQKKLDGIITAVRNNKTEVVVKPQPVNLALNGRLLLSGVILSQAFVVNKGGVIAT